MIAAAIAFLPSNEKVGNRLLEEEIDAASDHASDEEVGTKTLPNDPALVVSDAAAAEPEVSHHDGEEAEEILDGLSGSLRAIVVGLEHSGTTIVSQVMFNAPCAIGATETGFLIADSPADIGSVSPWIDWNQKSWNYFFYRLKPEDIEAMKKAKDFPEMIDILRHRSPLFNDLVDEPHCQKPYQMIDKTPKYIYPEYFEKVLRKTPGVPVVVLKKHYESLHKSWARRNDNLTSEFYDGVYNNVENMMEKYPNRIIIVDYDKFKREPDSVMQEVFEFTGLSWDPDYLEMTGLKQKFKNYPEDCLEHFEEWAFKRGKHTPLDLEVHL